MFQQLVLKSIESDDVSENIITDGRFQCCYRELPGIFVGLDQFFLESGISPGKCSVLMCGNSLPEAVLLLWLLYRESNFFLLPRDGRAVALPEFCQYRLRTNLKSSGIDIKAPGTYLSIESNPRFNADAGLSGKPGSILLKTSGSTSEPKLVMHSYKHFIQNAANCVRRFEITSNDRLLIPVPIYHMYALGAAIIPGIIAGSSISLQEKTNIITYLDREKQFQPNVSFLTPSLCDMFLRTRKGYYKYRLVITAGDRISPVTFEKFETKFGKLVNLYGSTELGAIATSNLADPLKIRSMGILDTMPGVSIDFSGKKSKDDQKPVLEILCRHDYGFDVYLNKKGHKIKKEMNNNFKTKDLGKRISKNRFQVVGRTGNSMNRSGILVAFSEVESIMEQEIPDIGHVVITAGKEDSTRGKKMIAWCELKPKTRIIPHDIRACCFDKMSRHMVPDEIRVMEEIPRLPNGKFNRKKLEDL
jgi:acyl-coenzyme A synthetase/AMP-(fatty) acid ligase